MNLKLIAQSVAQAPRHVFVEAANDIADPERDIRVGGAVLAAFVLLFLGAGSLVPLDAAAVAPGEITVSGHRQTVQQAEGGVISAIHVKDAQHVQAGQVLIELAGAEARANEEALAADVVGMEAQKARLQAEQLGQSSIAWPVEFASMTGFDAAQVVKAEAVEQAQFNAHAASVAAQKSVLRQRSSEMAEAARGYGSQMVAARRQQALLGQELAGMKSLAAQGYAPLNKVRELERTQAEIGGERGQYLASADQARQQAQENDLEILQVDKTEADKIADQLHDVETSLADALPKLAAAKDKLARAEVRAPVSGTVVGLSVFTVGGVIAPGQPLMDIVPDKAPLLIEARVSPGDAEDLHSGQTVEIRFPALHDRRLPIITGQLTTISADSLTDKRTGKGYFAAQVSVPVAQIDKLEKRRNADFALRPGLPVQVMVPLRKRTALGYILGPLGDTLWRAFRES